MELSLELAHLGGIIKTNLDQYKLAQEQLRTQLQQQKDLKEQEVLLNKSITYMLHLIQVTRQDTYNKIARVVNFGLREVFGPKTEFKIESDEHGKIPSCKFYIKTDNYPEWAELDKHNEDHGNGLVTLCAFFLQVVLHKLHGKCPDFILMDEPFGQVSKEYVNALGELINTLHKYFGLQFIIITHNNQLASYAESVIELP